MERDLEVSLKKVNSVLLSSLSAYCNSYRLRVKNIEDANDYKIVAELYSGDVLTITLISSDEIEIETFCAETATKQTERLST